MYCKNCGHEIHDEDKFCSECGTKVEKEEQIVLTAEDVVEDAIVDEIEEDTQEDSNQEEIQENLLKEEKIWYFVENNESKGPFSNDEMEEFLKSSRISESTYVWKDGFSDWKVLKETDLFNNSVEEESIKDEKDWYYIDGNAQQQGPFTESQMNSFIDQGLLSTQSFVWCEDMEDWQRLKDTSLKQPQERTFAVPAVQSTQQSDLNSGLTFIQEKNIAICVILSIVTCGIYALYWLYCIAENSNRVLVATGRQAGTSAGMVVLLSIITCGLYEIYFWYKVCTNLSNIQFKNGYQVTDNSILCLILAIFKLSVVSMCIVQDQINGIIRNGQ